MDFLYIIFLDIFDSIICLIKYNKVRNMLNNISSIKKKYSFAIILKNIIYCGGGIMCAPNYSSFYTRNLIYVFENIDFTY